MKTGRHQNSKDNYYVGIDAGSVSLNAVVINSNKELIFESDYKRHFGRLNQEVYALMEMLFSRFGESNNRSVGFTGVHGQALSETLGVLYEFENISQVLGVLAVLPNV